MKDQFNKFGFGKMKKKDGSVEETPGSCEFFNKTNYFHIFAYQQKQYSGNIVWTRRENTPAGSH